MLSTIRDSRVLGMKQIPLREARVLNPSTGLLIALVLCILIGGPQSASAQQMLLEAKAAEQVGEKLDGFLAVIDPSAPAKVKKLVEDTNNLRMERYKQVAKIRGATLDSVGKQAGAILFKRALPGQMLETADGKWTKKE